MELAIRNAHLRGRTSLVDILIRDGVIASIEQDKHTTADHELDAEGRLALPGFVDAHIHLDKALLGEKMRANPSWSINEGIEITNEFKRQYDPSEVSHRAVRVMREALRNGTTTLRTFVDIGTIGGVAGLEGLLLARDAMAGLLDVQIVAFPQEGIVRDPGADKLLDKALKMGADVVGGMPGWEYTDADAHEHIDICFELAKRHDRDIHMIVDPADDPNSRSLEYLAIKTLREGWQGRVSTSWDALGSYNDAYAAKVIELVKAADISVLCNTHVTLMFYGREGPYPKPRGGTRIQQLLDAGVNVAAGQDDVNDPYYPFGKPDLLEVAFFMSHVAYLTMVPRELEIVIDMITVNAARALRLSNYGIAEGNSADIVVVDAPSVHEALRTRADRRAVVKAGRIVFESRPPAELLV